MTIQRQYILPNCNLILEGLSTAVEPALEEVMSVVMNAECHFPAAKTSLKGGRGVSRWVGECGKSIWTEFLKWIACTSRGPRSGP